MPPRPTSRRRRKSPSSPMAGAPSGPSWASTPPARVRARSAKKDLHRGCLTGRITERGGQAFHLVVAGEERLQVGPEIGVRGEEPAAVRFAALLERLDVGQEDLVQPLLAVGVAATVMSIARLPRIAEQLAEPLQPAEEQPDRGRRACVPHAGHLGHRQPLQVMQLHDAPLVFRQPGQGGGKPQQLLAADGPFARATSGRPRAGTPAGTTTAPARPPAIAPGPGRASQRRTAARPPPGHSPGWRGARPATRPRSGRGTASRLSWACSIACWTTSEASIFA